MWLAYAIHGRSRQLCWIDVGLGHVTCFGWWNMSRLDTCYIQSEAVNVSSAQLLLTAQKFLPTTCPREELFPQGKTHISELSGAKPSPAELIRVKINPQPLYNVDKKETFIVVSHEKTGVVCYWSKTGLMQPKQYWILIKYSWNICWLIKGDQEHGLRARLLGFKSQLWYDLWEHG